LNGAERLGPVSGFEPTTKLAPVIIDALAEVFTDAVDTRTAPGGRTPPNVALSF